MKIALPPREVRRWLALAAGPLAGAAVLWLTREDPNQLMWRAAAIGLWMAVWWIGEAVPIAVTALLPLILFPLGGVLGAAQTSSQYMNSTVFLFFGGFALALAMERWGLPRRLAVTAISLSSGHPARLLWGILLTSGLISMWMSNTAVALMMMPIAMAVVRRIEESRPGTAAERLSTALVLAVAFGASIGGIGTPVGSPPNLIFMEQYDKAFPEGPAITFLSWTLLCTPLMLVLLFLAWASLYFMLGRGSELRGGALALSEEEHRLPRISGEEVKVLLVFMGAVLCWLFRSPLHLGSVTVPGWGDWFTGSGAASLVDDGTVAVFATILLFILPAGAKAGGGPLLRWKDLERLPWGTMLLFGGGFALAEGLQSSGFSAWIGAQLASLASLPPMLMLVAVYMSTSAFGELASNTAVAQVLLPIAASISETARLSPALLMIPVAIAASLDFLLPAATPPNAIAVATGKVSPRQLLMYGLFIEIASAFVTAATMFWLAPYVLSL